MAERETAERATSFSDSSTATTPTAMSYTLAIRGEKHQRLARGGPVRRAPG